MVEASSVSGSRRHSATTGLGILLWGPSRCRLGKRLAMSYEAATCSNYLIASPEEPVLAEGSHGICNIARVYSIFLISGGIGWPCDGRMEVRHGVIE